MTEYYYDTYAIIEFARGNEAYLKYFEEPSGVTTRLNLMEVYYAFLENPDYAEELFASFSSLAIDVPDREL